MASDQEPYFTRTMTEVTLTLLPLLGRAAELPSVEGQQEIYRWSLEAAEFWNV